VLVVGQVALSLVLLAGASFFEGDIQPTLYIPMRQSLDTLHAAFFEVRTTREPLSMVPDARKAVAAVNPALPLYEIKTQAQQIDQLLLPERMFATLTTFFGVLALALVCVGLYGIVSYGVAAEGWPPW